MKVTTILLAILSASHLFAGTFEDQYVGLISSDDYTIELTANSEFIFTYKGENNYEDLKIKCRRSLSPIKKSLIDSYTLKKSKFLRVCKEKGSSTRYYLVYLDPGFSHEKSIGIIREDSVGGDWREYKIPATMD